MTATVILGDNSSPVPKFAGTLYHDDTYGGTVDVTPFDFQLKPGVELSSDTSDTAAKSVIQGMMHAQYGYGFDSDTKGYLGMKVFFQDSVSGLSQRALCSVPVLCGGAACTAIDITETSTLPNNDHVIDLSEDPDRWRVCVAEDDTGFFKLASYKCDTDTNSKLTCLFDTNAQATNVVNFAQDARTQQMLTDWAWWPEYTNITGQDMVGRNAAFMSDGGINLNYPHWSL